MVLCPGNSSQKYANLCLLLCARRLHVSTAIINRLLANEGNSKRLWECEESEVITCVGDVDKALLQLHSCNLSKLSNLSISSRFDETYAPPADTEGSLSPEPTCQ